MIKKQVKLDEMKPSRRHTIEIPANFASGISVSYGPSHLEPVDIRGVVAPFTVPDSVTISFTGLLLSPDKGLQITEYIEWETGAVYKSKLTGKLYLREDDGWICLKYKGQSSYAIPDYGARSDFEGSLVKLVEEK